MIDVVVYYRVSTEDQNIAMQRFTNEAFAQVHNMKIVSEFVDDGISGVRTRVSFEAPEFTLFNQQKGIKNNAKKRLVEHACQLLNSIEKIIEDGTLALLYSKMGSIG